MSLTTTWVIPPSRAQVRIVNAGLDAFCSMNGFAPEHSKRIQLCFEGLCNYCIHNQRTSDTPHSITVKLFWVDQDVIIYVEHLGKGGEWDSALSPEEGNRVRRTSFDALGLYMAREIAHTLTCETSYDITIGDTLSSYKLVYRLIDEK